MVDGYGYDEVRRSPFLGFLSFLLLMSIGEANVIEQIEININPNEPV